MVTLSRGKNFCGYRPTANSPASVGRGTDAIRVSSSVSVSAPISVSSSLDAIPAGSQSAACFAACFTVSSAGWPVGMRLRMRRSSIMSMSERSAKTCGWRSRSHSSSAWTSVGFKSSSVASDTTAMSCSGWRCSSSRRSTS